MDVSREPLQSVAEELAAAGVVPGQPEEDGVRPIETLYAVTVAVPPSGRPPALYQVAVARIETPPKSLLVRLLQFLRNEF